MEQITRFIISPTQHDLYSLSHVDVYVLFSFLCWFVVVQAVPIKTIEMDNSLNYLIYLTFIVWSGCLLCIYLPLHFYNVSPPIEWSTIYLGIFIAVPTVRWIREKGIRQHLAYMEAIERMEQKRASREKAE
ncbi:MAG: hypothetical protein OXT67_04980 [Zetaproteobacteria bacterium]|nr:hypothetical protein [Zetaproteobacteria bacterium]